MLDLRRARIACADRPTLLVLGNFEQILDAAPLVVDLLTSVVSLRVLATSRAPPGPGRRVLSSDLSSWQLMRMRCRPRIWPFLPR